MIPAAQAPNLADPSQSAQAPPPWIFRGNFARPHAPGRKFSSTKSASNRAMAQLYPVSTTPLKPFYPIGTTPAACLTSHLPPGVPARCLLLGHGDARNILFTIYSELGGSRACFVRANCRCSEGLRFHFLRIGACGCWYVLRWP
jgi:Domain of unknown function (DUF4470)